MNEQITSKQLIMLSKMAQPRSEISSKSDVTIIENTSLISLLANRIKTLEAELSTQKTHSTASQKHLDETHLTNRSTHKHDREHMEHPILMSRRTLNVDNNTVTNNSQNSSHDKPGISQEDTSKLTSTPKDFCDKIKYHTNLQLFENIISSENQKHIEPEILIVPNEDIKNFILRNPLQFIQHLSQNKQQTFTETKPENSPLTSIQTSEPTSEGNISSSSRQKLPEGLRETLNQPLDINNDMFKSDNGFKETAIGEDQLDCESLTTENSDYGSNIEDIDELYDNLIQPVMDYLRLSETEVNQFYRKEMESDPTFSKIYQNPTQNFHLDRTYLTFNDLSTVKIVIPDKFIRILLQVNHITISNYHFPTQELEFLFENLYSFNRCDFERHLSAIESTCFMCRTNNRDRATSEKCLDPVNSENTTSVTDTCSVKTNSQSSTQMISTDHEVTDSTPTKHLESIQEKLKLPPQEIEIDCKKSELPSHITEKHDNSKLTDSNQSETPSDHINQTTESNDIIYIIPSDTYQSTQDFSHEQTSVSGHINRESTDNSRFSNNQKQHRLQNFHKNQQSFMLENKAILDLIDKRNHFKLNADLTKIYNTEPPIRQILRSNASKMPDVLYYRHQSKSDTKQDLLDEMRYAVKLIDAKNLEKTYTMKPPSLLGKTDHTENRLQIDKTSVTENSNSSLNQISNTQTDCSSVTETENDQIQNISDSNFEATFEDKTHLHTNDDVKTDVDIQSINLNELTSNEISCNQIDCEPITSRHAKSNDENVINCFNNQTHTLTQSPNADSNQLNSNTQLLHVDATFEEKTEDTINNIETLTSENGLTSPINLWETNTDSGIEGSENDYQNDLSLNETSHHGSLETVNDETLNDEPINNFITFEPENSQPFNDFSSKETLTRTHKKTQRQRSNSV